MATKLALTGIQLNDGVNYQLLHGWAPNVARRRDNNIGGQSPYEDVLEEIPLRVFSATSEADCLDKLHNLVDKLEDAQEAWQNNKTPSVLRYLPDGSGATAADGNGLYSLTKGPPPGTNLLNLQPEFDLTLREFQVLVTIPLIRFGAWHDESALFSSSSAAAEMASVATCTFAAAPKLPSPTRVEIEFDANVNDTGNRGFILVNNSAASSFEILEAETVDDGDATYASSADANASNGNISTHTPTGVDDERFMTTTSGVSISGDRFACFAVVRNNSTTIDFVVRWGISQTKSTRWIMSKFTTIDTTTQDPQVIYLGTINWPFEDTVTEFRFGAQVSDTTGTPTLDVDYFVLMAIDQDSRVVYLPTEEDTETHREIHLNPRPITQFTPSFYFSDAGQADKVERSYQGNIYFNSTVGTIAAVFMMTEGTKWRLESLANADINYTLKGERWPTYLNPI